VRDGNNAPIGQYFYDGEGKRVKKFITATGETTIFVYSNGKLVAEYSNNIAGPSEAKIAYTTTDHLGSPRVITDDIGQVRSRRDFLPFGEEINTPIGGRTGESGQGYSVPTDGGRQKFTGYQKDTETSLDFAEARMYENRFGRFTAVDPLLASGKSANPQTFNRFIYVGNNPIMITDPAGLDWYRTAYSSGSEPHRWKYEWFGSKPAEGNWEPVDFGDNVLLPIEKWMRGETSMGTGYLDRYSNNILTQAQFSAAASSYRAFQPGGGCYGDFHCAGLRNSINDNQSIFESERFTSGFPIGFVNQAKSSIDIPSWNLAPPLLNLFITDSMATRGFANPLFNYQSTRAGSESLGAFVGARTFDLAAILGTKKVGGTLGSRTLPFQNHHFATNKNSVYTPQMAKIADEFGLSLDGAWNRQRLPHLGRHPNAYHDFVLRGMQNARGGANGSTAEFLRLFNQNVKQPVIQNPNLLRKKGW
jgi:RHS repeat-associated protein